MKNDRLGGRRTNWLLIEHRDAAARPGDDDAILTLPGSIASGRSLDAIATGRGKAPTAFIRRSAAASGRGRESESARKSLRLSTATAKPRPVEPQLCKVVDLMGALRRSLAGQGGVSKDLAGRFLERKKRQAAARARPTKKLSAR